MSNVTLNNSFVNGSLTGYSWNLGWTVSYCSVAVMTVLSNFVTLGAFLQQHGRKRPRYLLISLSIADFLTGAVVMPLYISLGLRGYQSIILNTCTLLDILFGTASFLTLASVSLERLWAVFWPMSHKSAPKSFYFIATSTPWTLALVVALVHFLHLSISVTSSKSVVAVTCSVLLIALLMMCACYLALWIRAKEHPNNRRSMKDRKLAWTLLIATVACILTWLPMQVLFIILNICKDCVPYSATNFQIMFGIKLLQYSNSFINVFIYSYRMPEFRDSVIKLFTRQSPNQRRCQDDHQIMVVAEGQCDYGGKLGQSFL